MVKDDTVDQSQNYPPDKSRLNCSSIPGTSMAVVARQEPLLLSTNDAAELLGIGRTHFYDLQSSGQLGSQPVKLGRQSLCRRAELIDWVATGCPPRVRWVAMQKEVL